MKNKITSKPIIATIMSLSLAAATVVSYPAMTASVFAEEAETEQVPVDSIIFEEDQADTVEAGATITLEPTIDPEGFTDEIVFTSDNTDVLEITSQDSAKGTAVVKGKAAGEARITATAYYKDASGAKVARKDAFDYNIDDTITIEVTSNGDTPTPTPTYDDVTITLPDDVLWDYSEGAYKELTVGDTYNLKPVFTPDEFEDEISFDDEIDERDDDDVIKVTYNEGSKEALITAVGVGQESVIITTSDDTGELTARKSLLFIVSPVPVACESVSIKQGDKATMYTMDKLTLNGTVTPADSTDAKSWKITSGSSVVKISANEAKTKCTVTPKKAGTAKVQFACGDQKAVITITVKKPSVTLSKSAITIKKGKSGAITIKTKAPSTDTLAKASSASSKVKISKIDKKKGKVTVKGVKKCSNIKVTLTMKSGAKAVCKVTVK